MYKPEASVGHGESGRASTILGLDNFITTELHACYRVRHYTMDSKTIIHTVDERIVLVGRDFYRGLGQAEERDNGLSRVATNDRDSRLGGGLLAADGGNEGLGTNDIESGDTEEPLGVKHASALEDLGGNGNSRVDGVGDDQKEGLGGILGGTLNEALHDAGVDLEQIVTGHARLA